MLSWFQALMPKEDRFFGLFDAHAETLVKGADSLVKLLEGGDTIDKYCTEIHDHEHAADEIIREVLRLVRRTFITPFDRSAITDLIGSMDDAIDEMHKTATAIQLFEVSEFQPQMREMSHQITRVARLTQQAMPLMRKIGSNGPQLHTLTEQIVHIEAESDIVHETGVKALFRAQRDGDGTTTMDFIVGREIYRHLERVVDRFEDVANEIQGIVIDHA